MAQLALQIQNNAPNDRAHSTSIPSAFTVALDTVSIRYIARKTKTYDKIFSGSARANLLGNCRVSEEAKRVTYTLRSLKFLDTF